MMTHVLSDCPADYFGAGCKLKCHCQEGLTCNKATGKCQDSGGGCATDFTGDNCQGKENHTSTSNLLPIHL